MLDERFRAQLDRELAALGMTPDTDAPLLLYLLGQPPLPLISQMEPNRLKTRLTHVLLQFFLHISGQQPLVLEIEDLHWIDCSSETFLTAFIDQIAGVPILLLLSYRPGYRPQWHDKSYVTQIAVQPLDQDQSLQVVQAVLPSANATTPMIRNILSKAEGNPFFLEELSRTVSKEDATASPWRIPDTIQAVLAARIDQLPPESKRVLQAAAVVHGEVTLSYLQAILDEPPECFMAALTHLQAAEFMVVSYQTAQPVYRFRHTLTRDVAYHSLLRQTQRQYHQRLAQFLRQHAPERIQLHPDRFAHHATAAGWVAEAIAAWQLAGQQANERAAYQEATTHLQRGLELVPHLPHGAERQQRELALQTSLGLALMGWQSATAPEAQAAYARAYTLCQDIDDTAQLLPILFGLWRIASLHGSCRALLHIAERICAAAKRLPGAQPVPHGIDRLGLARSFLGEFNVARELFERRLRVPEDQDRFLAATDLIDSRIFTMGQLATLLAIQGQPQQAVSMICQLLKRAESLAHPYTTAYAHLYAAQLYLMLQFGPETTSYADVVWQIAHDHGFSMFILPSLLCQGWGMTQHGAIQAGIDRMQRALSLSQEMGIDRWRPMIISTLAQTYLQQGEIDKGRQLVAEGLTCIERTEERYGLAELYRLKGEALLVSRDDRSHAQAAEACFGNALDVAREQGAKLFELQASVSLGRLWHDTGQTNRARALLTAICGDFTDNFQFPALQAATTLLDRLSPA